MSNGAIALQVAINDDTKESNLISKKVAQLSMKSLQKTKYFIPMDYCDYRLQINTYKDVLISISGLGHLQQCAYRKCATFVDTNIGQFRQILTQKFGIYGPVMLIIAFYQGQWH